MCACWAEEQQSGLFFLSSTNGFDWDTVEGPFFKGQAGLGQKFTAPCLVRGPDGMFHVIWQTALRGDQGFGYAHSTDLINWSEPKYFDLMVEQKAYDVVSPELFYDGSEKQFIITWASTLPGNYFQCYQEDVEDNPRLWYTATRDFESFVPARLFFQPGYSVQDGVLIKTDSGYALIHDDHRRMFRTLRVAFSDALSGPWNRVTNGLLSVLCENPTVLKVGDDMIVYYHLVDGGFGALVTKDFTAWQDLTGFVSFPEGYRIGSIMKVDTKIVKGFRKVPRK